MSVACNSQYLFLAQITWRWQVGGDWVLLCFVCLLVLGPGLNGQETCGRRPGSRLPRFDFCPCYFLPCDLGRMRNLLRKAEKNVPFGTFNSQLRQSYLC